MMNHIIRRSAAPAVACLVSSAIYQNFTKPSSSSEADQQQHRHHHHHQQQQQHGTKQRLYHQYDTPVAYCDAKFDSIDKMSTGSSSNTGVTAPSNAAPGITKDEDQNQKVQPSEETQKGKKEEEQILVGVGEKVKEREEEEEGPLFYDLFPERQLWKPTVEYPLWDEDWDGRKMKGTGDETKDLEMKRSVRKNGVTKHIILIRHGQYDEKHKEDEKRILTPLGRKQAELTGQRLAEMLKGFDEKFGPCNIKTIRVSNMARAKETADIIAQSLPATIHRAEPDANLNEGRPCHHIPGGKASARTVKKTDESHGRIETAFKTYFYRADPPVGEENDGDVAKKKPTVLATSNDNEEEDDDDDMDLKPHPQHEFEIIVCHANVIRYFLCRALQLPPEAWLRLCTFNCSLTYLTVRPTGTVSCRMLGDIGHLGYAHSTFSMHHGFNW